MTDAPDPTLDDHLSRRMLARRTLVLGEPLEDHHAARYCQALLLLAADDPHRDVRLLIHSPGGSVPAMLAIRDTMRTIPNDVSTVALGIAYSAGQFLLSSGTPGKRYALPHAKVLLHQGSAGIGGRAMDIAIQADDLRATRDTVLALIAADTGQDVATVERDSQRDHLFTAEEARAYGFVDHVVDSVDALLEPDRAPVGLGVRA